ncbi:MAG: GTP cyclohydrolase I [bacterium]|nr:GTP cyclohydrolase I [bacterium]
MSMDREKMAEGVRAFLDGVSHGFPGDDQDRTPDRVARAWCDDLLSGYAVDPAGELSWTAAPRGTGPVVVRGIRFSSVCVHHLLPFIGRADVAYLPDERLAGLSKIGRVVDAHARRLQTQEHLTAAVVETLQETLCARGVLARFEAEHTCMTLRGVRKEGSRMITLAGSGVLESDAAARAEALALFSGGATRGDG